MPPRAQPRRLPAKLPTGGRGTQAARQLLLLRYRALADGWVTSAELCEQLYGRAYRTLVRDLRQLQTAGVPVEWDEAQQLGWRLRPMLAVEWLLGDRRRAVRLLREIRRGQCRECAREPIRGADACATHATTDEKRRAGVCTVKCCPERAATGGAMCRRHRERDRVRAR